MPRFRVPHTLVLLFGMIVVALVLTYLLPHGHFERVTNEQGREQVIAGTYEVTPDPSHLPAWAVFTAIPRGFAAAQDIIFFILLIGGTFGVLRATGAIDALIGAMLPRLSRRPILLVAGGMVLFAVGSSTIGMAEEYLPFVPILLALCIPLGFDAVAAVGIMCVGYGIGYGTALINPFTVLIAQEVAGLQPTSGWHYRLLLGVLFLAIGIHHVWRYASRVKGNPATSLVHDVEVDPELHIQDRPAMSRRHVAILALFTVGFVILIYGLSEASGWHWYIGEMGAMFLALTVVIGVVSRMDPDRVATEFTRGAAELTGTALLVGFARAILVILEDGAVIDTIVYGISLPLQSVAASVASVGMLVVQSLCNLFIPSGSGQAYVTMPIMAPLADLVGIERQVAVLAYQFGDGFTNIMIPTNAVLVGILAMARVPFQRWMRFVLPFMFKIWIAAALALAVAVWIGYS